MLHSITLKILIFLPLLLAAERVNAAASRVNAVASRTAAACIYKLIYVSSHYNKSPLALEPVNSVLVSTLAHTQPLKVSTRVSR